MNLKQISTIFLVLNIKFVFGGVYCKKDIKRELANYDLENYNISNCGNEKIFGDIKNKFAEVITYLDASKNFIKVLKSAEMKQILSVEYIDLSDNQIQEIKEDTFSTNSDLKELILSDNLIWKIHVNAFPELEQLRKINLSNNELETLEPKLFKNQNLEEIDLSLNFIKIIAFNAFYNLENLQVLNLQKNPCANETFVFTNETIFKINKILFENTICFKEKYCNASLEFDSYKVSKRNGAITNGISALLIFMLAFLISI
jgi:Leucine-rich repeat (LRR) protein